jgi:hypothetical protein
MPGKEFAWGMEVARGRYTEPVSDTESELGTADISSPGKELLLGKV